MKKLLPIAAFFCVLAAHAQDGWFLQPEFGVGVVNTSAEKLITDQPGQYLAWGASWHYHSSYAFSYNAKMLIGYRAGNGMLTTGIILLRSGYYEKGLEVDGSGPEYWYGHVTQYYYHITVPVMASENFKLNDRLSVVPGLGLAFSYNISSVEIKTPTLAGHPAGGWGPLTTQRTTLPQDIFNAEYSHSSGWVMAKVLFSYRLNERTSIVAGPEADYMLTNFWNYHGYENNYQNAVHNYDFMLNAGITWNLKSSRKADQHPAKEDKK